MAWGGSQERSEKRSATLRNNVSLEAKWWSRPALETPAARATSAMETPEYPRREKRRAAAWSTRSRVSRPASGVLDRTGPSTGGTTLFAVSTLITLPPYAALREPNILHS